LGQGTVLIVDDSRSNRLVIKSILSAEHRTLEAANGLEALEALAREPVDLVLLDVMMPDMDGFAVCREIKKRTVEGFLPVILVTALTEQEDRTEGLKAGADDFLTKPVERNELLLRCRAFLELRRKDQLVHRQIEILRRMQSLKDDLTSMIVHDIRNPLQGIEGYLELIRMQADDAAAVAEDADSALQSSRKLRELVEGMLSVRLLEEEEMKPAKERVRIDSLVADAIGTLQGASKSARVPLQASVPDPIDAMVDRKLVMRALENVISNAIKYSPKGVPVEVAARRRDLRVEVDVSDRGPGIPDDLKSSMFQKFGSLEAKKGHGRLGFGLGLHLVKLVATAHGGDVSVLDREGGGATFRLSLPAGL